MLADARFWFNRILADILLAHLPFYVLFHCGLLKRNGTYLRVIFVLSCTARQTLNRFGTDLPIGFPLHVSISWSLSNHTLSRLHNVRSRIFTEHSCVIRFELSIIWPKTDLVFCLELKLLLLVWRKDRILLFPPCRLYKRKMLEKLCSFSICDTTGLV